MRRKSKKILLAVILAFVFGVTVPVLAAEKTGSITVELNEIGTNRKGVELECFHVAEQKGSEWHLTEAFAKSHAKPWNLSKSVEYKTTAKKLSDCAAATKLSSETRMTDREGKLVFSDLKEGIYLLCQKSGQKTYGVISPFLVCIPMEENGKLIYDVHTNTKGEDTKKITPAPVISTTPAGSSDSSGKNASVKSSSSKVKTVKTGDDTALIVFWLILIAAAGGTVGILYYRKKH